jgi:mannose-6-phosphate isomerase-like protein (cupin superfamily)
MNIQTTPNEFQNVADRPWGQCTPLTEQGRFKVRHLIIAPGQSLGAQSHFHRSEHWIAVSGSGRVTINGVTRDLFESQSIDIPIGALHKIENHGRVDLHLIEVQTGSYLGEDDVVRHAS